MPLVVVVCFATPPRRRPCSSSSYRRCLLVRLPSFDGPSALSTTPPCPTQIQRALVALAHHLPGEVSVSIMVHSFSMP